MYYAYIKPLRDNVYIFSDFYACESLSDLHKLQTYASWHSCEAIRVYRKDLRKMMDKRAYPTHNGNPYCIGIGNNGIYPIFPAALDSARITTVHFGREITYDLLAQ